MRFSETEISHTTGAEPNSEADKSLTLTGQKMEMNRKPLGASNLNYAAKSWQ